MLFNSYIFILFFLPLCLIGYFILNHYKKYELALVFLIIMSLWFYGYFNYWYLIIIIGSILFNYFIYILFNKIKKDNNRKVILVVSIFINFGVLFYFKYFNFFIQNINSIFNVDFTMKNILLPLGISFFTFQQVSFIIDAYKKQVPIYSLIEYTSFVTYFPQLIAGPIVTYDELIPQFKNKKKRSINYKNLLKGIFIFTLGLSKKVLLADTFANAANIGFNMIDGIDSTNAIITILAYTIQIYFDFSGYCDMALGIGKMMNIDLPLNFNSPYKALTITDFWKRWHITLTRFFTKYVYIPLGGNRKGKFRTYLNILIIFFLSGMWHGANWTFILWGILHGVFSIITRSFKNIFDKLHPALNWIITFIFINLTWVLFRANTILEALRMIKKVLVMNFGSISSQISNCFNLPELNFFLNKISILKPYSYFSLTLFFTFSLFIILGTKNSYEQMNSFKPNFLNITVIVLLLILCIISLTGISTFLYFNF